MRRWTAGLGCAALAVLFALSGNAANAQSQAQYAQVSSNNLEACASGRGPAVRVQVSGLRSGNGNLFVRIYKASKRDWLKGKRYLTRVDARPRQGSMTVCIPVATAGNYAIAVQHDENGNREMDFSTDGAGMSNNPKIGSFLGIPRPPSVSKATFAAGTGITPISISVRYRD